MPKQNRFRRIGQVDFTANGVKPIDLPRALLYHYLSLRLSGNVTIVTAPTTAWADAPWSLVRRVEIIADGKDTIKSIDLETLKAHNTIFYGTAPKGSAIPTAVGAAQAFNAQAILPFEMPRSVRPIDSLFDSKGLSTFTANGTWGDVTSLYSAASANATINSAALEFHTFEAFGISSRFAVHKQLLISKDVTAVDPNFQVLLPVGNLFRGILIRAINYGAAPANVDPGTPSDAIINNIQLKSGTEVYFNKKGPDTQDDNKRLYSVETWPAGCYMIDFTQDGMQTESLDARALSSLELILDVSNPATTNKIKIYPIELIQPPEPVNK